MLHVWYGLVRFMSPVHLVYGACTEHLMSAKHRICSLVSRSSLSLVQGTAAVCVLLYRLPFGRLRCQLKRDARFGELTSLDW